MFGLEHLQALVSASVGVVTGLIPFIGYQEAARIAKKALSSSRSVAELVVEAGLMNPHEVKEALSATKLAGDK